MASVEEKRRQAVLTDLALAESDLVRLPNAHADNPVGPPDGVAVLEGAGTLLLAAACSADWPQRMYRAARNKLASRNLNRVRLGHTEPGSYVIILLLPAAPALATQCTLIPLEDSFGRRVAKARVRIAGVQTGGGPVQPGVADFREFESRLREGISANLCRSVARLTEVGEGLADCGGSNGYRPYAWKHFLQ